MKLWPYTELQKSIINGTVDINAINGNVISKLLHKALRFNDKEVIRIAQALHDMKKEEARKRTNERSKKAYYERKERGFTWKPPIKAEYTERQNRIVYNKIPLDLVLTRELYEIYQKSLIAKDYELSDRMLALYYDRINESAEKNRIRSKERNMILRANKEERFSHKGKLNKYELAILKCEIDLSECSIIHLNHIKDVCIKNNDDINLRIVELLIYYKNNPETVYSVHNHKEALDLIESHFTYPIRRIDD